MSPALKNLLQRMTKAEIAEREGQAEPFLVGPLGFELEAFTRRRSRVPKSRAQSRDLKVVGPLGFEPRTNRL